MISPRPLLQGVIDSQFYCYGGDRGRIILPKGSFWSELGAPLLKNNFNLRKFSKNFSFKIELSRYWIMSRDSFQGINIFPSWSWIQWRKVYLPMANLIIAQRW